MGSVGQVSCSKLTISKANLPSSSDTATLMARQIHREPTDNDGHGAVSTHSHEEECAILQIPVFNAVDVADDAEAGHGHADRQEGAEEAVPDAVGDPGEHHREEECDGPGWDGVKLGFDC